MISIRAVTLFVFALLISGTVAPGVAAANPLDQFTSPYNTAFSVEADVFERDRTPAVSFSNNFAGFRQVDPLVVPGQRRSMHDHAWLGSRLTANTDINRLFDAPQDWAPDSNATERNRGFAGMTTYQGRADGYTSGVWWPTIWDAPPGKNPVRVTYLDGISAYYVARADHGNQYLEAYPNGLGFLVDQFEMKMRPNGRTFNVNFLGPMYWDGKNLTSDDHRSHLSYTQSASHPVAIPQFQTFIKARLGYPNDPTPLEDRLKFGNPGAWTEPHLDYVAGFRQPWFHQWLLDLGPNWGHPDNPLRDCGVSMPARLDRRKLEGVRLPAVTPDNGRSTCSSGASPRSPGTAAPQTAPPTTRATTAPPTTRATTAPPTTRATTAPPTTRATTAPTTARASARVTTAPPTTRATTAPLAESSTTRAPTDEPQVRNGPTTTFPSPQTLNAPGVEDAESSSSAAGVTETTASDAEQTESPVEEAVGPESDRDTLEVVVDGEAVESAEPAGQSAAEVEPHEFCPIGESEGSSVEQIAAARLEPGLILEPMIDEEAVGDIGDPDEDLDAVVPATSVTLIVSLLGLLAIFGTYRRSRRGSLL